jgi:hypothetical protein
MKSPTLNGLDSSISTPPAKLAKLPCNDKPIANVIAPNTATNEVISIPSVEAADKNSNTFSNDLNNDFKNFDKVGSIFFPKDLSKRFIR